VYKKIQKLFRRPSIDEPQEDEYKIEKSEKIQHNRIL
jgi:hypothetical protein